MNGGAVQLVGASAFFDRCDFFQNKAMSGGAVALGPLSKAFMLDTNYTGNRASNWGQDIFLSTPVGSTIYTNRWPPERLGKVFPRQADIKWYYAPPPAPEAPPSPPPAFRRAPYPPPLADQPPARVKQPPPSPPRPPPNPPPAPPSPPMEHLVKEFAIPWGVIVMAGFLLLTVIGISCAACCHRRLLPRIEDPDKLRRALENDAMSVASSDLSDVDIGDDDFEVLQEMQWGAMGNARMRRRAMQQQ
jgi:hypothetical protein